MKLFEAIRTKTKIFFQFFHWYGHLWQTAQHKVVTWIIKKDNQKRTIKK